MSEYRTLKGRKIKTFATDLSGEGAEGQLFFSTAAVERDLKIIVKVDSWASGGNLNSARERLGGSGTQTAGLAFGGNVGTPPAPGLNASNTSEEYNGAAWTEGNNLNTARLAIKGAGTQTATVAFGGSEPATTTKTEEYNGTSWAEQNDMSADRAGHTGFGTQTAAVATADYPAATTEEYDGTSWTAGGDLGTARYGMGAGGTLTAGVVFGGASPVTGKTEEYDGSSWTESGDLNQARLGLAGSGTQTAALAFGGAPGPSGQVSSERYDGTSWAVAPNLASRRFYLAGCGTQALSLAFGGFSSPSKTNVTEEFTFAFLSKTVTDS